MAERGEGKNGEAVSILLKKIQKNVRNFRFIWIFTLLVIQQCCWSLYGFEIGVEIIAPDPFIIEALCAVYKGNIISNLLSRCLS